VGSFRCIGRLRSAIHSFKLVFLISHHLAYVNLFGFQFPDSLCQLLYLRREASASISSASRTRSSMLPPPVWTINYLSSCLISMHNHPFRVVYAKENLL
jgi:hypothetical protein